MTLGRFLCLLLSFCTWVAVPAMAHKASDSYLVRQLGLASAP
mgnify:CR=1 FL=1